MVTLNEAFPSKYLKATDLQDSPVVATIKLAELEQIKGFDGKTQAKVVIYFARGLKPLILNRTNYEAIMDICGSDDTDDFPGTKVELHTPPVTFNGKTAPAVRIRAPGVAEQKPQKKAAPPPSGDGDTDEIPFAPLDE